MLAAALYSIRAFAHRKTPLTDDPKISPQIGSTIDGKQVGINIEWTSTMNEGDNIKDMLNKHHMDEHNLLYMKIVDQNDGNILFDTEADGEVYGWHTAYQLPATQLRIHICMSTISKHPSVLWPVECKACVSPMHAS